MQKRFLGTSSIKVTPIVLGTWAIGGWLWGGTNEKEAIEAIHTSIDQGISTIDTAAVYGMGLSEELIGRAIKGCRDKVVIATKCGMRWEGSQGCDPFTSRDTHDNPVVIRKNLKPESIIYECEQSLKRLDIEEIDLYQIHWPDKTTPLEESWGAMIKLLEQGKVRSIGVCNYTLDQLSEIHALYPVHSIQSPYSLIRRTIEESILPFCENNNIALLAYSSLERGLLTGKIALDYHFQKGDHRIENPTFSLQNRKQVLAMLDKIKPLAEYHQATVSQIILNCTYHMPGITAALVGARNGGQALENAKAAAIHLTEAERIFIIETLSEEMQLKTHIA